MRDLAATEQACPIEEVTQPGATIAYEGDRPIVPAPAVKTEAPLIIAQRDTKSPPIVIEHTQERMTPFCINGQVWGWAYRNDPQLIIQTLQAAAAQVLH